MIAGVSVMLPRGEVEKYKKGGRTVDGDVKEIRNRVTGGVEVLFEDEEYLVFPEHRVLMIHVVPDKEEVKLDE